MSNYRRARDAGACYFFTLVSHQRRPVLTEAPLRAALRRAIERVRLHRPFIIEGWILLPDHLHCVWRLPEGDADFGSRWSMIKRLTSQALPGFGSISLSRSLRRESGLWQRRFWEHRIRDEGDYQRHMDYLHFNPVKHGLVERVADWPWSSFHRLVKEGVYPADWGSDAKTGDGEYGE
ncbi:MAG: transposase [Pseudomonas sp.]|jgi:putative transposase|uniref:Putative transposase n=2 Tax=Pseudomonadaceae TaxID=135621 RepID=A0A1H2LW03_9PSED|nr:MULTISPECIES: transposase [Pseudomonas]KJU77869.1 transposase [Pseudomonas oleovorans]MPS42320.1 transposase [Pseudomonas sp.]ERH48214.1 transposase [Pseudomonas chengduensis]KQO41025.1 transposase [Pseudomonas sp. Leaf83]MBG0846231.1 transposase [Pseudomonas chengduensis]